MARDLGVSQSTVSLALSGSNRVSEATRQRVLEACARLDYRPNAAGRGLRTGRSHTVGLFVPQLGYEVFDRILMGVRTGLALADPDNRWSVLVGSTDNDASQQESLTAAIGAHDFDGLILAAVGEPGPGVVFGGPIVGIETAPDGVPVRSYDLDQVAATALRVLTDNGHRCIAHLSALPDKTSFAQQRRALERAAAGLVVRGPRLQPFRRHDAADVTTDSGLLAIRPMFDLPVRTRPTAVICDDSRLAAAVYVAADEAGLSVPQDLSVFTTHLDDVGRTLRPALDGMLRPAERAGELAARALLDALAGRSVPDEILLPSEHLPGASVARRGRG
ncbi:LacI family DNA-binding transcriptional regulator [Nakamurella alba]|uniref:LacI family DNA-binding transcriptional regulator n=1 Tax=Nakamurella alba TaxID=2665158 RepID=UPI002AC3115F|nr:LacI family DNA-binding transcriptional regulator [Nakamurella alba]